MDITTLFLCLTVLYLLYLYTSRVVNGAPGPLPLPIIGNLYQINKGKPHLTFHKFYQKYGNIFSINLGSIYTVVLNEPDIIQEALVNKQDVFSDRYHTTITDILASGRDLAFSDHEYWKKVRGIWATTFTRTKVLKFEDMINQQITKCVYSLGEQSKLNQPINIKRYMKRLSFNIAFTLLFSKETTYDESAPLNELDGIIQASDDLAHYTGYTNVSDLIFLIKPFATHSHVKDPLNRIESPIKKFIEEHKRTIDRTKPRNFMDSFLMEVENDKTKMLDDISILKNCVDFIVAGTDTTASSIDWAIIFLANNQDIQEKVFNEVSQFVEDDIYQFSTLRNSLQYTNNFIKEVWRMRPIVPLSLPHKANQDIIFHNHFIPKDTLILLNLYSASYSEKFWNEPYKFEPNRHIESKNSVMVFSYGNRKCVGMNLAEVTILLAIVMLIKKFRIERISKELISEEIHGGFTMDAMNYKVILKNR